MLKELPEVKPNSSTNNKNTVNVNNQFSLTINLGDSLNLLALIAGVYFIRRMTKKQKAKHEKM